MIEWLTHPDWGWFAVGLLLGYPFVIVSALVVVELTHVLGALTRYGVKECWRKFREGGYV